MNNRYFRSYKHFVGTIEQNHRVDSSTEVIHYSYSMGLTATKIFNNRWSLSLTISVISNARSSKYVHYGNAGKSPDTRRMTRSFGVGDARLALYKWLFSPAKSRNGNVQAVIGIKLPTGDYCYRNDSTFSFGPVDQSIRPGDGGIGITMELKGFYSFSHQFGVYGDMYYLVNPREQKGTSAARGAASNATVVRYFTSTMSVPGQYMMRAGANYMISQFTFSGGIRIKGIPASDLVGGDKGFRRPAYVISAEPVISYMLKKVDLYLSVPVALQRKRTQSYADKLQTATIGNKVHGDAAFADYSIDPGCIVRL
jgi:hypothetical protein